MGTQIARRNTPEATRRDKGAQGGTRAEHQTSAVLGKPQGGRDSAGEIVNKMSKINPDLTRRGGCGVGV